MEKVIIYTDGACSGNPGPGGWAAILMYKDKQKEISGGMKNTTNNVMELTAVIEGLKMLAVAAVSMICGITVMFLSSRVGARLGKNLREKIFRKI